MNNTMPEEPFEGMVIGGIRLLQKDNRMDEETEGSMIVKSTFEYLIGVKLTESDTVVEPIVELVNITPGQVSGQNVINATLENTTAALINNLTVHAEVYSASGKQLLYDGERKGMRMAPNSLFAYPIYLGNQPFKAGKYKLRLQTISDEGEWTFEQEFEITKEVAKKYNEISALKLDYGTNWWLYGGIIAGILLLLIIVVFYYQGQQKKKIEKERQRQKKKRQQKKKKKSKNIKEKK